MATITELRQRYIKAMVLINKTPLEQSTKNRLQSVYESICYAADEVVGHKMQAFALVCFEEEQDFKDKGICNELRSILIGSV
jgi:hypothetical protein